ncbi:hypothetical protein ACMGD3_00730 [Lysinibacillus sphaericus]|uniref:hypothetical protein n=1 Tax=Lysinibacillus sphaericus TaxID=1421 RepID=UPI001C5E55F1
MSDASQQSKEQLTKLFVQNQRNNPAINYYGLWTDEKLIGGMRLHDFAELSSLVMGIVTIKELFILGKVNVSNEQFIETLNQFFFIYEKIICVTAF